LDGGGCRGSGGKLRERPELIWYLKLARAHGRTLPEYLAATTSRDLAEQDALARVDGPQGQDRMDLCFAWLASWWVADRDKKTVWTLYANLIHTLRNPPKPEDDEIVIIEDDSELSRQKTAELTAKLLKMFPREPAKG
jgi:hypothetical protein